MRGNAHKVLIKERKLLKLYSIWHETHQEEVEKKYLSLLGEILALDPAFNPRRDFQLAS